MAPGKKLVGIVGMGMLAVVPQVCVARSSAILGASYPVGALTTVLVVASYAVWVFAPWRQNCAGLRRFLVYADWQEYHCESPLSVHMLKSSMSMPVQGAPSAQASLTGPRCMPSASVPVQLVILMLLSWTPSPEAVSMLDQYWSMSRL